MKRTLLLLLLFSPILLSAQQNVGINVDTPKYELDVRVDGPSNVAPLTQIATASEEHFLRLFPGHDDDPKPFMVFHEEDTFRIARSNKVFGDFKELLTIRPNGNTGIGQPYPQYRLDVAGNIRSESLMGVGDRNIVVGPDGEIKIGPSGADTDWTDGGSSIYNLTQTIGVGTMLPTGKLEVRNAIGDGLEGAIKIFTADPPLNSTEMVISGNTIDSKGKDQPLPLEILGLHSSDLTMVKGGGNVGVNTPADPMHKMTVSGFPIDLQDEPINSPSSLLIHSFEENDHRMIFDGKNIMTVHDPMHLNAYGDQPVAIGSQDVAAGYMLSVAGKVMAEEMMVQLRASWPDYVFDDTYELRNLNELRDYIQDEKHLPGIPAASEVETSGLELGEMQRKMMEKIEELTLYILELHDRVDFLEQENKALQMSSH